jgi:hypothetical protein
MKLRVSQVILPIFSLYLVTGLFFFASNPLVNSFIRIFRVLTVPILVFTFLVMLAKLRKFQAKAILPLAIPILILCGVNFFLFFILPPDLLAGHRTSAIRVIVRFATCLCILLCLNPRSALATKATILRMMVLIFVAGVAMYPSIILDSGVGISKVLSGYGQTGERFQSAGLFGSSNEDANGLMTLFPAALLAIENRKGLIKKLLRVILLVSLVFALLYNGSRTALLGTLPLVTFLFYSDLSFKRLLQISAGLLAPLIMLYPLLSGFVNHAFAADASGEGTLSWRVERVWTPVITYTQQHSPIFGFGLNGWEYLCSVLNIYKWNSASYTNQIIPAHSGYVWVFASWGLVGLLAYIFWISVLLVESYRLARCQHPATRQLGKAMFCSMLSYCLWAFISNVMAEQGWLLLLAITSLVGAGKVLLASVPLEQLQNQAHNPVFNPRPSEG